VRGGEVAAVDQPWAAGGGDNRVHVATRGNPDTGAAPLSSGLNDAARCRKRYSANLVGGEVAPLRVSISMMESVLEPILY